MKKILIAGLLLGVFFLVSPHMSFAQTGMMGGYGSQTQVTPSPSDLQDEENMQNAGLKIYQNLQAKKITCQQLTNRDFEKLGEYFMGQAAGSTQNHVYWDQHIQSMMGEQGDTQMHIVWGQRGSGCFTNGQTPLPSNVPAYFNGMMNYQVMMGGGNYGYPMMGWVANTGVLGGFATLTWIVGFIDLVLGSIFLWKQIRKK